MRLSRRQHRLDREVTCREADARPRDRHHILRLRKREKQIRERFGFLDLPPAICESELAEDERKDHLRSSRLATELESSLATTGELQRRGALGNVDRANQRSLKIDLELSPQSLVLDLVKQRETLPQMVDGYEMRRLLGGM